MFSDLSRLVRPRSAVLIGASERSSSVGGRTLTNMAEHSRFDEGLFLVNPNRAEIGGQPCHRSVADLPITPDVAVVTVSAAAVPAVLEQCAAKGIPFAVVLTSGFGETDEEGRRLEAVIKDLVARTRLRVYGPNCPGITNINHRLGLTFSPAFAHDLRAGPIGVATQGGGLGRGVLQGMERGVGFGLWGSTGNELDLQVADFIHYMAGAPDISVIVALIEGIKDGPRFVAAARRAAENGKPIVALKLGRSEYGAQAAASHTAAITGSAEVNSAAFRQLGIIEVDDIDELVDVAALLARRLPRAREQLAVFGNSGGSCVLTADFIGMAGLTLGTIGDGTRVELSARLPSYASLNNPIDTTSATLTDPPLIEETLVILGNDPAIDIVLAPLPLDYGPVTLAECERIVAAQRRCDALVVPIWMSERPGAGYHCLAEAGLIPIRSARNAGKALRRYVDWGAQPRTPLLSLPRAAVPSSVPPRVLSEVDSKAWLAGADLPIPQSGTAASADEAARIAAGIGSPVVLKVVSPDIIHKSDIGGVVIGCRTGLEVRDAYARIMASIWSKAPAARIDGVLVERLLPPGGVEVLVAVSRDLVFGHVMTFGLGGIHVELFKDVARWILPIDRSSAEQFVRGIKAFPVLDGTRGRPGHDVAALCALLVKLSDFSSENASTLDELELNPVWVGPEGAGVWILDAVITARA